MICFLCLTAGALSPAEAVTMVKGTAVCAEHIYVIMPDELLEDDE